VKEVARELFHSVIDEMARSVSVQTLEEDRFYLQVVGMVGDKFLDICIEEMIRYFTV